MDYRQALAWVHALGRAAQKPGLARMEQLMAALGHPQRRLRFIHVVGTNGKGSTTMMLSSILAAAGLRVGATVSPYVLDFRERFQLNGEMISQERLAAILSQVRAAAQALPQPPIEFEVVTAAALLYFAQEHCDIVCLEAGIGGRLDSTNVVENTLVACVTKIGLDHQEFLGETLTEIAGEKCGVFKRRCTVVSYPEQQREAAQVIAACAKKRGCALVVPAQKDIALEAGDPFDQKFSYQGRSFSLSLAGRHQVLNASVAIEATRALRPFGIAIGEDFIYKGLKNVHMPARIERLNHAPLVVVDGAHNADSAAALAQVLKAAGANRLAVVAGFLRDKPAGEVLALLAPYMERFYAVAPASPRALSAETTAAFAAPYGPVKACGSIQEALNKAWQATTSGEAQGILVCGSFYVAAGARVFLREMLKA